jgi:hypothetical protein
LKGLGDRSRGGRDGFFRCLSFLHESREWREFRLVYIEKQFCGAAIIAGGLLPVLMERRLLYLVLEISDVDMCVVRIGTLIFRSLSINTCNGC